MFGGAVQAQPIVADFVVTYDGGEGLSNPSAIFAVIMSVSVEFYGIARARAGVAATTATGKRLGDVLTDLATRFPLLAEACIDGRQLKPGFTANLAGRRFITDPETPIHDEEPVLLMSLDAGG